MSKEIFVLSDIHLGSGLDSDWYKKSVHEDELLKLLDFIAERGGQDDTRVELVLAGDVFDTWLCPMDETPPTIKQIIEHNTNIIDKLKDVLRSVDVFYMNGNHDMHVTAEDLSSIAVGNKSIRYINEYRSGLMKVEHGHRYAMFNARDKLNDPQHGLPIGYFITRLLAGDESYDGPGAIASYVDDLLEAAFTTQTISSSVIEALTEHVGKSSNDAFKMPFGRKEVTIAEVKKRYAKLFDLWVDKFGYLYAINSIRAEMGSLNWFADRLARKHDYNVVIMGHTHGGKIDEDRILFDRNRVYANAGYWATKKPSYIHVNKDNGNYAVTLFEKQDREFEASKQVII